MHDPEPSSPPPNPPEDSTSPPPAGDPAGDDAGYEVAHEIVGNLIAWYSRQLLLARRSGDQERLEDLKTQRQQCVDDQHRLREAGPEEVARIAASYAARLKELDAAGA
ncbi:hypothetical protein ACWCQP_44705 [Streptomyces chartreusis]